MSTRTLAPRLRRQRGVTAIEYAILAAALAATLFAVAGDEGPLRNAIDSAFERVETTIAEGGE
ncbi:hypothetical protein GCM10011297_19690 [Bacterioplanes sanyensis]|uniref:Flp family type IVb pilin n=1 Tax=Bacterioplanes sanyensis TaxID=1249553 RepID=UPI001672B73A|nr:Flp family type IVb pilin [Bacterioplanes sanyensis]GGY46861.1 hypothetical protein GCM10011297_19690 [Bacterioplanes sanyensis]